MSKEITFANFDMTNAWAVDVYSIGTSHGGLGVVPEVATAFGFDLDQEPDATNLGELIKTVAPDKMLRNNIARFHEVVGPNALETARRWVESSGLLLPVERSFQTPEVAIPEHIDVAVITGGVRNWMIRRTLVLDKLAEDHTIGMTILGAGLAEADYMQNAVEPALKEAGFATELVRVESTVGDEVMDGVADAIGAHVGSLADKAVLVVSNAGAWVQNAGQLRRAMYRRFPRDGFDLCGNQLFAASDEFPLGITGEEPPVTHQHPISAVGVILRGVQEITRTIGS